MYLLSQKSIQNISQRLNLPAQGDKQDWEFELADPKRIDEFLMAYTAGALSNDDKRALFAMILASLNEKVDDADQYRDKLASIITVDGDILAEILAYWDAEGTMNRETQFNITSLLREICQK